VRTKPPRSDYPAAQLSQITPLNTGEASLNSVKTCDGNFISNCRSRITFFPKIPLFFLFSLVCSSLTMSRPPGHPILPRLHGNGPNNGQRGVHPLKTSTSTSKLYVSWVDFRSVVQGITRLLGYSPLARGWESSVLKPLKDNWDGENTDTQEKLLARANDCKKRLSAVDSDERRGVDDYIVRGQIVGSHTSSLEFSLEPVLTVFQPRTASSPAAAHRFITSPIYRIQ